MTPEIANELIRTCSRLLHDPNEARAVLAGIGYPPDRLPNVTQAREFWTAVIGQIENGIIEGDDRIERLLTSALSWYPGSADLRKLIDAVAAESADQMHYGARQRQRPTLESDGPCFTLLMVESDQHVEFLETVRRVVDPTAELLYATRQQSAVRIDDPGDGAEQLTARLEAEIARWDGEARVAYARYDFRPYLYGSIVVYGPDGAPYELRGVPATTLVRDIPFAVLSQYNDEAVQDSRGRYIQTTVDLVSPDGTAQRLDPDQTLHDAQLQEGGAMRVSAQATAGSSWYQEAVETARAQITSFAERHPEFTIIKTNHPDLPTAFDIQVEVPGFAPPEDFDQIPLEPVRIDLHKIHIGLPREFPRQPPSVFFDSPVFHPNVVRRPSPGIPKGVVCLGPLMDAYRPDLDVGELCQMLVDVACYRNYEVRNPDTFADTEGFVDAEAASWARSPEGQHMIAEIGGAPLPPENPHDDSSTPQPPRPLWIKPWGDWDDGERR